jgi:hypothetical protein
MITVVHLAFKFLSDSLLSGGKLHARYSHIAVHCTVLSSANLFSMEAGE